MNLFIAGGTGAIGRVLVPLLVNAGHKVVALTRSIDSTSQLERMGAVPVAGDVYDEVRLARLVVESEAEVVIHQLTAFGTSYDPEGSIPTAIRKGAMPIVGAGAGTYSFINLRDAAAATLKILAHEARGIYNIVDDSPARLSEWLPFAAKLLDAPAPGHMDEALARQQLGDMRVYYMNEQRGASNAKAKRAFNWQPAHPSWRGGFEALYLGRSRESSDAV